MKFGMKLKFIKISTETAWSIILSFCLKSQAISTFRCEKLSAVKQVSKKRATDEKKTQDTFRMQSINLKWSSRGKALEPKVPQILSVQLQHELHSYPARPQLSLSLPCPKLSSLEKSRKTVRNSSTAVRFVGKSGYPFCCFIITLKFFCKIKRCRSHSSFMKNDMNTKTEANTTACTAGFASVLYLISLFDLPDEMSSENLLLEINEGRKMVCQKIKTFLLMPCYNELWWQRQFRSQLVHITLLTWKMKQQERLRQVLEARLKPTSLSQTFLWCSPKAQKDF